MYKGIQNYFDYVQPTTTEDYNQFLINKKIVYIYIFFIIVHKNTLSIKKNQAVGLTINNNKYKTKLDNILLM